LPPCAQKAFFRKWLSDWRPVSLAINFGDVNTYATTLDDFVGMNSSFFRPLASLIEPIEGTVNVRNTRSEPV